MKTDLALRLLSEALDWDTSTATEEFAWLRLMVDAKYDQYQGYAPGQRFFVHLIYWLQQFKTLEERQLAYRFLKERVIWISQQEMHHLVALSYPLVQAEVRRHVAGITGLRVHQT